MMIMNLTFDKETHTYRIDGAAVPTVTEIVSPITAQKYKADNPILIEQAKRRGTAVHEYTQLIDLGCPLDAIDIEPELCGYVKAYLEFLHDYSPDWTAIEKPVVHPQHLYAGTLDRLGTVDGKPALLDIKTTAQMDRLSRLALAFQLELYSDCLEVKPERLYGLQLKKDGNYKLFNAAEILSATGDYPYINPSPREFLSHLIDLSHIAGGYVWQKMN